MVGRLWVWRVLMLTTAGLLRSTSSVKSGNSTAYDDICGSSMETPSTSSSAHAGVARRNGRLVGKRMGKPLK